jgi:tetratricopeptide (TPR) repeat protein
VTLGEREAGTARLEEAITSYRAAMKEATQDRAQGFWATVQEGLGNALRALGEREAGTARLEEALSAYHAARKWRTKDQGSVEWAKALGNEGLALLILAKRTGQVWQAQQALEQLTMAGATLRGVGPVSWAEAFAEKIPAAQALVDRLSGG